MSKRLRDWQSRLQASLAERRASPFKWGLLDCVLLAADCMAACTGVDPAAEIRGTYSDAIGASRLVRDLGGLAAIAAAHCGPEVAPALAQPSDIGLVMNEGRECLAVRSGAMWFAPGASGVVALPASQAVRAWRLEKVGG